jgi:hypothetical protein
MAAMKAVAELPDDVGALKAMIVAMADQRALLEAPTVISKWRRRRPKQSFFTA